MNKAQLRYWENASLSPYATRAALTKVIRTTNKQIL